MLARSPIDVTTGVIEKPNRLYPTCAFELEVSGPSQESVAETIADYQRRGPNSSRYNIRFFPIRENADGGFVAHGLADLP